MGNWIEVAIVTMPDVVHFNRVYSNVFQPNEDNDLQYFEFIRLCTALKTCAEGLHEEYQALQHTTTNHPNYQPHLPRVMLPETATFKLVFQDKLDRGNEKLGPEEEYLSLRGKLIDNHTYTLFLATKVDGTGNTAEVIVKFITKYNEDAHKLLAKSRDEDGYAYAPALHGCFVLWDDNYGKLMMVIMDRVIGKPLSRQFIRKEALNTFLEQLFDAMETLHSNGYVFGDFRATNIMIEEHGFRPKLIDFDWVGKENVDVYPPSLNPALTEGGLNHPQELSDTAGPFRIMKKEHDEEAYRIICNLYKK